MLDPKYLLSEGELVSFLMSPRPSSKKLFGFKEGYSKYFQDLLKADRAEWHRKNVTHL